MARADGLHRRAANASTKGPWTLAGPHRLVHREIVHVLMPTTQGATGRSVARAITQGGHVVHTCHVDGGASDCAVLDDMPCPLDVNPVDVAVEVGPGHGPTRPGDGAVCALTRRIPLVLVDPGPDHPLLPWAADAVADIDVATDIADVMARPLPAYTDIASRSMLGELHKHGTDDARAAVEVRRRHGGLIVEVWPDPSMTATQAERMATHVAQAVRRYDGWAARLDVVVHDRGATVSAGDGRPT